MSERESILRLADLRRSYPQPGEPLPVLKGIDLAIEPGEMVALVGPSGSGKSTLLQIAGLLDAPTSGKVIIGGRDVSGLKDRERTRLRRSEIGFIYQFHHLLSEFNARENVMVPQIIAGAAKRAARDQADSLLDQVGLSHRLTHRPAKLSGGEQQRVAIARALANQPRLLLADEPTGNLDEHTADEVFAILQAMVRDSGTGALLATHNLSLAARMDRTVEIRDGRVV